MTHDYTALIEAARAVREAVHGDNRTAVHRLLLAHDDLVPVDEAIHALCRALYEIVGSDDEVTPETTVCNPCRQDVHDRCYYWGRHRWWTPCGCTDTSHVGQPVPVASK